MKFENVKVNSERWFDLKLLKNEKFKDIPNYNGRYQISNYGRAKTMFYKNKQVSWRREKILKNVIRNGTYYCVSLHKNNKQESKNVHKIVAETFLDNPNNYKYVNHKDENKLNNRIDNLEYCTQKYNCNYGNRNLKISLKNLLKPKSRFEKVLQFDKKGNLIKEYDNLCTAENETKIRHIRECCDKKRKSAGGYIFVYSNCLKGDKNEIK